MIAVWFSGHWKRDWFSVIEIVSNPGGKVGTCGTSLVLVPSLTVHSDNRWLGVVCLRAAPVPVDESVTGDRNRRLPEGSKIASPISSLST